MSDVGTAEGPLVAQQDDDGLIAALRAGDPGAFERLVREHGPRMRAAIVRMRGCSADVDDTLQAAFLSVFRAIGSFEGRSRLSTWLHRIAVNAALMRMRARRDEPTEDLDDLLPAFAQHGAFTSAPSAWVESPDETLQRGELRAVVRAAIEELPENYRHALLLHDIEELDYPEIAGMLQCTANAAKIRVHRARQALKALLERRCPELCR